MRCSRCVFSVLLLAALSLTFLPNAHGAFLLDPSDPESVVSVVTDYTIQSPRLYYLYDPGCTVGGPSEIGVNSADVIQYIGRTAVHGAIPRRLYEFAYDEFCVTSYPDILSNVDADDTHVYWVSRARGGLVRLSQDSLLGDEPGLVSAYDYDADLADIVVLTSYVYVLEKTGGDGLFRIDKATGTADRLLNVSLLGDQPNDLQSDGVYLYWRSLSGSDWDLKRYKLTDGSRRTLATGIRSFRPDPEMPGLGVYIGMHNELRAYSNLTESLLAAFYTGGVEAEITSITADSSNIYFLEQPTGTGAFTLYRLPNGTSTPVPLYTSSPTPTWEVLHELHEHDNYLYFLSDDELVRLPADADSITLTNMRITGMEVTQAIQSDDQSVPLIQGKRTAVRLFVESDGDAVPGVTAHLYRLSVIGSVIDGPLLPRNRIMDAGGWRESPYLRVLPAPDRDNIQESFLFFLPTDWIDDTTLRVRAELNPFHFPHEPAYNDNTTTSGVFGMQPSPRLETEVVLFEYEDCDATGCTRYAPRYREDFLQAVSWIRRAYPLASSRGWGDDPTPGFRPNWRYLFDESLDERVMQSHPDCPIIYPNPKKRNKCASAYTNGILSTLRTAEELPDSVFMYGMISDGLAFPRGQASGRVSSGPAGNSTWGWDFDGSYADWYMAHEIGHSLGRKHPTEGSALCGHSASDSDYPWSDGLIDDDTFRGFDVGNPNLNPVLVPRVYPGDSWYDVMTYCPNQWISNYTYTDILSYLSDTRAEATPLAAAGPYLQLYGVIPSDRNTVIMTQVRVWQSPANVPSPPQQGTHRVRLLDANNTELAAYDFTPLPIQDAEETLAIDLLVPFVVETRHAEIVRKTPAKVLWQYEISAHAPTVSDVRATIQSLTGEAKLRWTAKDTDGDALSFDILYSADDGRTWQMVRMGVSGNQTTIDTSLLAGSHVGRFKVLAHDGAHQGEGISPKIAVPNKAPFVTVLAPANGTRIAYGQTLQFVADVFDLQDGSLSAANILWHDQTGQLLGKGTEFATAALRIGVNEITVQATNSRGLSSSETVTVVVDDDLALPGPSLAVSPDQVGWHVADGTVAVQTATVTVGNAGSGVLTVNVEEDASWLTAQASGARTPLILTLTADPSYLEPGESLSTLLRVTGTAGSETQQIDVPVGIAMGSPYREQPDEDGYRQFLPLVIR